MSTPSNSNSVMNLSNSSSSPSSSNEGCHCTDVSSILASVTSRSCQLPSGETGVMVSASGPCVPYTYGSGGCAHHDWIHDPRCKAAVEEEGGNVNDTIVEPWSCIRSWCYVDAASCMQSSEERVYRSIYFTRDEGIDLFYSYSKCNPLEEDWKRVQPKETLGGISIQAVIPGYRDPFMYKRNADGDILTSLDESYYDSSIPYEGALIDYFDSLMEIANGDFTIEYTSGSKAAMKVHPTSAFTAAIQDIEDGLVDGSVGPFWITSSRLQMTSFTMPLYYDRTLLVIKNPGQKSTLGAETKKVFDPFTLWVWVLILALITLTAVLSIWFSDRHTLAKKRYGDRHRLQGESGKLRKTIYARLCLDEFISKGMFFCSAGVDQEAGATLAQKILLFGFSFFILIVVSAYVANMAAFLTVTNYGNHVGTMEAVVQNKISICSYSTLKTQLRSAWPKANFVFSETSSDIRGLLEDYDAGLCDVMAVSHTKLTPNIELTRELCSRDLVFTQSLVVENPIAFPVRAGLGPGLSYWMYQGLKYHGITLETAMKNYDTGQSICDVDFSVQDSDEAEDLTQIKAENLFFPTMFAVGCAAVAIVVQLYHQRAIQQGRQVLTGRMSMSALNLVADASSKRLDNLGGGDGDKKDDEHMEKEPPQSKVRAVNIATGSVDDDAFDEIEGGSVHLDGIETTMISQTGTSAKTRLHQIVETGALDDFFACYNEIRREKEN